jgi:patatin-like phospholipase/acyl hydrolase
MLKEMEDILVHDYHKKWMVAIPFLIVGLAAGYYVPEKIGSLFSAKYDRSGLDTIMTEWFPDYIENVITDEILITSYEYNFEQPRFYSKYFSEQEPGVYNISVGDATGASSSAPLYFDPKSLEIPYGHNETLIDGGLICNNPSLYAFIIAKYLRGHKNIRVLSLGTGENKFIPVG